MEKKRLTLGKYRGLQQIADERGAFTVVAFDHQLAVGEALNPGHPEAAPYQQMADAKVAITRALAPHCSAVLLDVVFAVPQAIGRGALPGRTGLLVTLEEQLPPYLGSSHARRNALVPGWNVEKIKRMGASAVKLMLWYHPRSESAPYQEALLERIVADCQQYDIALVLECLTHPVLAGQTKDSPDFAAERPHVVIESARRLCRLGGDAYKAEFPADVRFERDAGRMAAWCQELTEAAGIPWMVLSAAVDYPTLCRQVEVACTNGASGFLAGRTIWQEALAVEGRERCALLEGKLAERLRTLGAIADSCAQPWTRWYDADVPEDWYRRY